ncbi:MAG: hypothetical protein ABIK89_12850, partial [Planctomycetota bacterium]
MRPTALIGFVFVVFVWTCAVWGASPQGDTQKEASGGKARKETGKVEPKLDGAAFSSSGVRTGYAGHYACRTFTGISRQLCAAISD